MYVGKFFRCISTRAKFPALDVVPQGRNFKKLSEHLSKRWSMLFNQRVHWNLSKLQRDLEIVYKEVVGNTHRASLYLSKRNILRCCMVLVSPFCEKFKAETGAIPFEIISHLGAYDWLSWLARFGLWTCYKGDYKRKQRH